MSFYIGTPHINGAGYLWNDNTASGGVKEEADVRTCPHCQRIIKMQEWRRVEDGAMNGGFCMGCNAPVCGYCNKRMQTHGCEPIMQQLEQYARAQQKLADFIKLAGLEPPEPPRALIVPDSRS